MSRLNCDELLVILQEECAEVSQIISKIHRYGLRGYNPITSEYNDDLLHKEIGDLLCMIELCIEKRLLNEDELTVHIKQKREKLKKWSNLDHE
jgi:hypothetical protein